MNDRLRKKAVNLINKFLEEKLNGDIEKLKSYSFWGIRENGKGAYDNGKNYADGDCTKLAYAIAYLIYSEKIGETYSTPYYCYGFPKYNYHGDTICTFNTLFGSTKSIQERVFETLELSDTEKKAIIDESADYDGTDFYHIYQRIGNFYLLPCKTIKIDKKCHSLNSYRGFFQNDFFDTFLKSLDEALNNERQGFVDSNFYELTEGNCR